MTFRLTYREIRELARKTFLHTLVARGVARKAGLIASPALSGLRTVIDAYVSPLESPLARQYAVDLTGATEMRLTSQSNVPIYIFFSLAVDSEALDPGDFQPLSGLDEDEILIILSASIADSVSGGSSALHWLGIPEVLRVPLRLTISTGSAIPAMNSDLLDGSFSMALQIV